MIARLPAAHNGLVARIQGTLRTLHAISLTARARLDTFRSSKLLSRRPKNELENHGVGGSIPPLHHYLGRVRLQG